MAKAARPKKPRAKKYDEKLSLNGSFVDVLKATVKDAELKSAAKKQ